MADATALTGSLKDGIHILPVRIYFEDTDLSGIVYHANYLRYAERGRSDYLRAIGVDHTKLLASETPVYWTLHHIEIDFKRPARIDDLIEVHTVAASLTGARLLMVQSIRRGGQELARVRVNAACISPEGKVRRIPQMVRDAFAAQGEAAMGEDLLG
ncbi:MAG: YbgC/FadM family acyl-CoA thioesterase [Alphaproteobacteria bacterium]